MMNKLTALLTILALTLYMHTAYAGKDRKMKRMERVNKQLMHQVQKLRTITANLEGQIDGLNLRMMRIDEHIQRLINAGCPDGGFVTGLDRGTLECAFPSTPDAPFEVKDFRTTVYGNVAPQTVKYSCDVGEVVWDGRVDNNGYVPRSLADYRVYRKGFFLNENTGPDVNHLAPTAYGIQLFLAPGAPPATISVRLVCVDDERYYK